MSGLTPLYITRANKDDTSFCSHCNDQHKLIYFANFRGFETVAVTVTCKKARLLDNHVRNRPMFTKIYEAEYYCRAEKYVKDCMSKSRRDLQTWVLKLDDAFGVRVSESEREEWLGYLNVGLRKKLSLLTWQAVPSAVAPLSQPPPPPVPPATMAPVQIVSSPMAPAQVARTPGYRAILPAGHQLGSTCKASQFEVRQCGPPKMSNYTSQLEHHVSDKASLVNVPLNQIRLTDVEDSEDEGWPDIDEVSRSREEALHDYRVTLARLDEEADRRKVSALRASSHISESSTKARPANASSVNSNGTYAIMDSVTIEEDFTDRASAPVCDDIDSSPVGPKIPKDHPSLDFEQTVGPSNSDQIESVTGSPRRSRSPERQIDKDGCVGMTSIDDKNKDQPNRTSISPARSPSLTTTFSKHYSNETTPDSTDTSRLIFNSPKNAMQQPVDRSSAAGVDARPTDRQKASETPLNDRITVFGSKKDAMAAEVAQLLAAKSTAERDVKAKQEALEASESELTRISATCKAKSRSFDEIEQEQKQLEQEAEDDSAIKCASLEVWWQDSCARSGKLDPNIKRRLEDIYIQGLFEYKQEETERLHKLKRTS